MASEEAKICFSKSSFIIFWKIFKVFFGFSMVKIHFLQKVLKKWSSFRKKNEKKFSITGGGGQDPIWNFPKFIYFFLTLPQHKFSIWLFYVLVNFPFNHSVQNTSGEPLHKFCSQEKKLFSQSWTPNLSFFKFFLVLKHLSRGLAKLQMKLCEKNWISNASHWI